MKKEKIEKLKAAGFEVGDTASFLKPTSEEVKQVNVREIRETASGAAKIKCGESV